MCLHAAARKGHVGVVRALLSKGATVDTKTKVRPRCLFSIDDFLYSLHLLSGNCYESVNSRVQRHVNLLGQKKVWPPLVYMFC